MNAQRISMKARLMKWFSVKMALIMLFNLGAPTLSYALTGGPSQPEVQGFTPAGTSEMVNVFTGDFNYNIPLLDVDGYPINLSYNSGSGLEDEASWVGLGWSLNVGAVARAMRGLPDDFKGDEVTKTVSTKPSKTIGFKGTITPELFGVSADNIPVAAEFGVGFNYNNYNGFGYEKSVNMIINSGKGQKGPLSGSLGITADSNNGISIQPSLSLIARQSATATREEKSFGGLSIGTSLNRRSGLKGLTITPIFPSTPAVRAMKSMAPGGFTYDTGMPTYTPTVSMNMKSYAFSARFTIGAAFFGAHPLLGLNGYWSEQGLQSKTRTNKAYGYMYAEHGQGSDNALMDFNREKDGSFTEATPILPQTSFTYDVFSVSGQGAGGSFRTFRSDAGHVFDAKNSSTSTGDDFGVEVGLGATSHGGANISVTQTNSKSGIWTGDNYARGIFKFHGAEEGTLYEPYYFKEASELGVHSDPEWWNQCGGTELVGPDLRKTGDFDVQLSSSILVNGAEQVASTPVKRSARENRSAVMSTLSVKEVKDGFGLFSASHSGVIQFSTQAKDHHIGEITTISPDGSRYVYAIPAYNTKQKEVTFAVGTDDEGSSPIATINGMVSYSSGTASVDNDKGKDNYYSSTETPGYAHSFLLTALLSPDYIDKDEIPGPSIRDFGTYTLFHYSPGLNYKWRTPVAADEFIAAHNDGVRVDPTDDKGSYVYGEKELRYLERIETKNYVAVFETEYRRDALGVTGESGALISAESNPMRRLLSISLYTRQAYDANMLDMPIKKVHFDYEYELCAGVPNAESSIGKLTLKKVFFTFQKSEKGRQNLYQFEYGNNPDYRYGANDRWGNYKACPDNNCFGGTATIPGNDEFPYTIQSAVTDEYASAWQLSRIHLPSGGTIEVEYESDDYAFVQDRPAMEMFPIIGVWTSAFGGGPVPQTPEGIVRFSEPGNRLKRLLFRLDPDHLNNIQDYLQGIGDNIYMKVNVNLRMSPFGLKGFEPVPLYVDMKSEDSGIGIMEVDLNGDSELERVGYIDLSGVSPRKDEEGNMNPISKAAIQFGRMQCPQVVYYENAALVDLGSATGLGIPVFQGFNAIVDLIKEIVLDPNSNRYSNGYGQYLELYRSFVRLSNPTGHKRGGGSRVKEIMISDNWTTLSQSSAPSASYGQHYQYVLPDGKSSGVATYEPMIGGDENPFRTPLPYNIHQMLAPDESRFIELPVGESFFPSPTVGYSRVVIEDIFPGGATDAQRTGKVVQEFYTAKDFPTITRKTTINPIQQKTNMFSIASLLKVNVRDHMTAGQGFLIETNDMHGKQKGQYVYSSGQGQESAISSVVYEYQSELYYGKNRLKNSVSTIHTDGSVAEREIGVNMDLVSDYREEVSSVSGSGMNANLETFIIPFVPPIPVAVMLGFPKISSENTRFRSATMTKVVHRFGILSNVIATDNTSTVSTRNMAYDAVTGQVLLTETINNYNDPVYNFTFPAHWHYDPMGPAFKNLGYSATLSFEAPNTPLAGWANHTGANKVFIAGDELSTGSQGKAWVDQVEANRVRVIRKSGQPVTGSQKVKVIRSGRKNMSTTAIAQLTTLANPIVYFASNIFESVLQASAIEFNNEWGLNCECNTPDGLNIATTNPFITGEQGMWRPVRSYAFLTDREQSYQNRNTNIRRDGVFTTFSPFYRLLNGKWNINKAGWTFASEITAYTSFGEEIENRDALGRFSSAQFGYKSTLPVAVAANAAHSEMAFSSFEDAVDPLDVLKIDCGRHFNFSGGVVVQDESHTGRSSLRVVNGQQAVFEMRLVPDCIRQTCNLDTTMSGSGSSRTITIINGTGPYILDPVPISGQPQVSIDSGEVMTISGSNSSLFLNVVDSLGCQMRVKIIID